MKKFLVLFAVLVFSVGFSYAQQGGQRQRMSPEQREKAFVDKLGLDASQQAKYHAISEKYSAKMKDMRQQMRGADESARQEMFPKMRELMTSQNKEVRAILNADQIKKFDEMQKQREARMKNRGMRPAGQRGGNTRPGK